MVKPLGAAELKAWLADPAREKPVVLDVRDSWELEKCRFDGALHIPMREIPARLGEIDRVRPIVTICHLGGRSMQVASFIEAQQRRPDDIYNLSGGVAAWSREVDPTFPTY
jgi:rhodanese-related sulfurtransferase